MNVNVIAFSNDCASFLLSTFQSPLPFLTIVVLEQRVLACGVQVLKGIKATLVSMSFSSAFESEETVNLNSLAIKKKKKLLAIQLVTEKCHVRNNNN